MNIFQKLSINKIGIALTLFNWILLYIAWKEVVFSIQKPDGYSPVWELVFVLVLIFNLPAILAAALLWLPALLFGDSLIFIFGVFYTSLLTMVFQWMLAVKVIYKTFSPTEAKLTTLSLTDE